MLVIGFIGITIMLTLGIVIFSSVSDSVEIEQVGMMDQNLMLILIAIPITLVFLLPILFIFGLDILSPIRKILIYFGLMVGIVKMRKIDD